MKASSNCCFFLEWGIDILAFRGINYLGSSALYFQALRLQVAKLSGAAHTISEWELSTAWAVESEVERGGWWKALGESATFFFFFLVTLSPTPPDSVQFSSVSQSCPTLCDPWTAADQASLSHHLLLPELTQTHVHRSSQWCHPTISSSVATFSSCPQFSPESECTMSWLFAAGGQSIGTSASASVPPMNIQDWLLLGLTGLISWQSKGLSRVFSNTTVQKHQFFSAQLSLWSNSHIHTWLLEKP